MERVRSAAAWSGTAVRAGLVTGSLSRGHATGRTPLEGCPARGRSVCGSAGQRADVVSSDGAQLAAAGVRVRHQQSHVPAEQLQVIEAVEQDPGLLRGEVERLPAGVGHRLHPAEVVDDLVLIVEALVPAGEQAGPPAETERGPAHLSGA